MDTFLAIASRRETRQYDSRPLPDAVVDRVLQAGRVTGSAANRQPWRFVLVERSVEQVAGAVYEPGNVRGAALVVAVVLTGGGRALFDAGRAAQNMALAAWNDGVGSCPNGVADPDTVAAALGLAVSTAVAACAPADQQPRRPGPATSAAADRCAKDKLPLAKAGKLTVGTDKPAYEPWFKNDDPANGQGFESAVAYAVARQLGFDRSEVTWTVAPFNTVIQPGPKKFDFDINQVSITEERRKAVDFSSGYYDVSQAVIALKDSKIAGARSVADLKQAKLGAAVGTTSY